MFAKSHYILTNGTSLNLEPYKVLETPWQPPRTPQQATKGIPQKMYNQNTLAMS